MRVKSTYRIISKLYKRTLCALKVSICSTSYGTTRLNWRPRRHLRKEDQAYIVRKYIIQSVATISLRLSIIKGFVFRNWVTASLFTSSTSHRTIQCANACRYSAHTVTPDIYGMYNILDISWYLINEKFLIYIFFLFFHYTTHTRI